MENPSFNSNTEQKLEKAPKRVLEIGAGCRSVIELLQNGGKDIGYSVVSDFNKKHISNEDTTQSLVEMGFPKNKDLQRMVADAYNLPFKNESFDYVVAMNFFGDARIGYNNFDYEKNTPASLEKIESLFKELSRVLSSNGEVCIIETYTPEEAKKFFDNYKESYDKYFSYDEQPDFISDKELFTRFSMWEGEGHFVHALKKKN